MRRVIFLVNYPFEDCSVLGTACSPVSKDFYGVRSFVYKGQGSRPLLHGLEGQPGVDRTAESLIPAVWINDPSVGMLWDPEN